MQNIQLVFRKLIEGIPLILGVTFISFLLMVYFGPDLTYLLLSKNPTEQTINEVRQLLGYNESFWTRYTNYLIELVTFDFGFSLVKDQPVSQMLSQSIPVSLQLMLPGFILGNLLALYLAIQAAKFRGLWQDKLIMMCSVIGMSISFIIVIICFQLFFSSSYGLGWFPVRGWQVHDLNGHFSWLAYAQYIAVPTMATIFVSLGYNTRFYRAVLVEQLNRDHITTAKAFGHKNHQIYYKYMLKNAMAPIITRVLFSIPLVVVGGSLLIESYFGIPGVGLITYDAILAGDQPVLKAIVGLTAILFALVLILTETLYHWFDPRLNKATI